MASRPPLRKLSKSNRESQGKPSQQAHEPRTPKFPPRNISDQPEMQSAKKRHTAHNTSKAQPNQGRVPYHRISPPARPASPCTPPYLSPPSPPSSPPGLVVIPLLCSEFGFSPPLPWQSLPSRKGMGASSFSFLLTGSALANGDPCICVGFWLTGSLDLIWLWILFRGMLGTWRSLMTYGYFRLALGSSPPP
jgi:hypothetical protein